MQNWGKFSLYTIRAMGEVQIVLSGYCGTRGVQLIRAALARTKFSMWCDGAEMDIKARRRTPATVASPAAVTYQEKYFFYYPNL
jgi:hypothetical protein